MTSYNTDISPAIQELKKLHNLLIDHIEKQTEKKTGAMHQIGMGAARETVISILPGGRRKEDGWYKWRMWEKKSDDILNELSGTKATKDQKYHEIFVAGEALQDSMEDIVLLMMHQVAHQAAAIQSTQSYHSEWIKIWYSRLFEFPMDAAIRDEVMGWYRIDKSKLGPALPLVKNLAAQLEPDKFDLFRVRLGKPETTGKMYKWVCGCKSPIVRTGGILYATCEKCGEVFQIVTKGVRDAFLNRVPEDRRKERGP